MTTYQCIECLLTLIIIENFAFAAAAAANIIYKFFERLQIAIAVKIVAPVVIFLVIAHPMRARSIRIIQINYATFMFMASFR